MLRSIVFIICSGAALASVIQDPIGLASKKSFIDEIYGELVDTQDSRTHKAHLLQSNLVTASQNNVFENIEPETHLSFSQLESQYQESLRRSAHNGYLRSRSKVKFPDDDDTSDLDGINMFGGIVTYAGFPTFNCFDKSQFDKNIDIAIVGAPFDTGVSYRPGARFGPDAIRSGARRLKGGVNPARGNSRNSPLAKLDPYRTDLSIIDCGDVPMTPFDNRIALNQLYRGERAIHAHSGKKGATRVITMGGDHTITLMALRAAYEKYGKLAVLHFDSHIDTWNPKVLGGGITDYMSLNHGTFLHYAAEQGYLAKDHCLHLGIRAPYVDNKYDEKHDRECGFDLFTARDIDSIGTKGIVDKVKSVVGNMPVYISVDIDVLDPSHAPGTGTMEVGGWTTRELLTILDSLDGLHVVGADVVEVSPPFDSNSEITSLAATAVIDSILGLMVYDI
ncbi:agmatinase [Candidozyma auris]|uniref:agmatinase n=1 Tax=Candidozyma auris TaxID=498019 RepID=UPI000D2EA615|nr:agmatinase [[Candida] auris]QEO19655.1 agmatinase [[Candida] auris]GBL50362.1 putative agmatinase [[Candida] auris]